MVDESEQKFVTYDSNGIELIKAVRDMMEHANIEIPEEVYNFLNELTPGDVGREVFDGGWVVRYEGFSNECIIDVENRLRLPASDPRHLQNFEDVFDEVLTEWKNNEKLDPLDWGFIGDDDQPIQYAVFYKGN